MEAKAIGIKLRELRRKKRCTLKDVAKEIGVTTSALAMCERGERVPRDDVKIRLARFYDRRVGELFFGEI